MNDENYNILQPKILKNCVRKASVLVVDVIEIACLNCYCHGDYLWHKLKKLKDIKEVMFDLVKG